MSEPDSISTILDNLIEYWKELPAGAKKNEIRNDLFDIKKEIMKSLLENGIDYQRPFES